LLKFSQPLLAAIYTRVY